MADILKLIEDAAATAAESIMIDAEAQGHKGDGYRALADAGAAKALIELAKQIAAIRRAQNV